MPSKNQFFFLWLISHDRLSTRDFLIKRKVDVPTTCLFCDENESIARLFLHCSFVKTVWSEISNKLHWFFSMPADTSAVLQAQNLLQHNKASNVVWNMIPAAILWNIWKEHNGRVFPDTSHNARAVAKKVVYCLFTWALTFKKFESVNASYVMKDWCNIYFHSNLVWQHVIHLVLFLFLFLLCILFRTV